MQFDPLWEIMSLAETASWITQLNTVKVLSHIIAYNWQNIHLCYNVALVPDANETPKILL